MVRQTVNVSLSSAYKISNAIIRSPSLTTLSHYCDVYMTSPKPLTHKLGIKYWMNKLLEEDTGKPQLAEVDPYHHAMHGIAENDVKEMQNRKVLGGRHCLVQLTCFSSEDLLR